MSHTKNFFSQVEEIAKNIDYAQIEVLADALSALRHDNGRLFFLGVGGSAANCSHAVNDFRKLCNIECYAPTDNVSELTARINDDGWDMSLVSWLKVSKFCSRDGIFILSVGGGNKEKNVSVNLISAIDYAKEVKGKTFAIVGRDGGYAKLKCDISIVIPDVDSKLVTPLSESYQSIIWHSLVSNPKLQEVRTKW